jgi:hypothetical protein
MGSMILPASLSSFIFGEIVEAMKIKPISTPALINIAAVLEITHMSQNLKSVLCVRGVDTIELFMNELLSELSKRYLYAIKHAWSRPILILCINPLKKK